MKMEKVIKAGLILVIIGLFVLTTKCSQRLSALSIEQGKNEATIADYQSREEDRNALFVNEETVVLTAEQKAASHEKSIELGNKVCEYQNAYINLDSQTDPDGFNANVQNLKACFNLADNGSAAVPWYPKSATISGTWTYVINPSDGGQDGLWLCRNPETGVLLAYAMADYDLDTGLFKALTFANTFAGNAAMSATESTEEQTPDPNVEQIQQMADEMTEAPAVDENGEPTTTEATTQSAESSEAEASARESNIEGKEKYLEEQAGE